MTTYQSRGGDPTFGPLPLKSIWVEHTFRDFDLMVIIQASGCEHIADRVIAGESISASDKSVLEIANNLAEQKGYLPLFDFDRERVYVAEEASGEFAKFFSSDQWLSRDPQGTRKL